MEDNLWAHFKSSLRSQWFVSAFSRPGMLLQESFVRHIMRSKDTKINKEVSPPFHDVQVLKSRLFAPNLCPPSPSAPAGQLLCAGGVSQQPSMSQCMEQEPPRCSPTWITQRHVGLCSTKRGFLCADRDQNNSPSSFQTQMKSTPKRGAPARLMLGFASRCGALRSRINAQ